MVKMLIGGEQTDATATDELAVIDPATEEVYETVPAGGVDAVDLAVQAAHGAFEDWSAMDAEKRAEIIRKALDLIATHYEAIGYTLTHEQGKPTMEAGGGPGRRDHPVQLSAHADGHEDRPSARGRQYRGRQAGILDAARDAQGRR